MTLIGTQIQHKNGTVANMARPHISNAVRAAPPGTVAVDVLGTGTSRNQYDIHYWRVEDIVETGRQASTAVEKARNQ